jgi:hypothetical protein
VHRCPRLRRVPHEFIVPACVPRPRKFHNALDEALEAARDFTGARKLDVKFAMRAGQLSDAAEQAGHDIIYAHGPFAFCGHEALEHTTVETRRAKSIADTAGLLLAAVYHFSFSALSQECPQAVLSFGFQVGQVGWAQSGLHWILEMQKVCSASRPEYEKLLAAAQGAHFPQLGEPVAAEFFHDGESQG